MRDIKFKYWWQFKCHFLEQIFTIDQIEHGAVNDYICSDHFPPQPLTSGKRQFTGLQDVNGVDIYEGDIVKEVRLLHDGECETCYEVKYLAPSFVAGDLDLKTYAGITREVIGDIHQNPELIA